MSFGSFPQFVLLPKDITLHILSFLHPVELLRAATVSKWFKSLATVSSFLFAKMMIHNRMKLCGGLCVLRVITNPWKKQRKRNLKGRFGKICIGF
jgi:hypothetical protein